MNFPTLMRMVADKASVKEIAELLKIPVGTAKSWTNKARKELPERLKEADIF